MKTPSNHPISASSSPTDTLTVLWVQAGKMATKQFSKTSSKERASVKPYDAGYLYRVPAPIGISSIEDLSAALRTLEDYPRALIIRGAPISADVIDKDVARTGSGEGPDFVGNFKTPEQGRHYLEVDVDKFDLPKACPLKHTNIRRICEHVIHLLPPEFHLASYHWQLSSSAGVFDKKTVSLHLWFWLALPVPDGVLKTWAKHVNAVAGIKLIDPALFQHVQPHYVAAPLFKGMADPFPVRSGLVIKSSGSVDLQLPPPDLASQSRGAVPVTSCNATGGSGFDYYLAQIGDHPGGDGFHMPIVQAVASFVAEHGQDDTDVESLTSIIQQRVLAADASKHSQSDIDARSSREHITSAITSALRKFGATSQRRKSHRLLGLKPDTHGGYQDIATIQASIDAVLDEVF